MRMRRGVRGWQVGIGLVLVSLIVCVVGAVIFVNGDSSGGYSESGGAAAQGDDPVALSGGGAVFVGDSYIKGDGAPGKQGLAILAASKLGLTPTLSADAQSGYTRAGRRGYTTRQLVDEAPDRLGAQIVVLASGFCDVLGSPPDSTRLRAEARSAVSAAADKWPRARIIVLGPWTPSGDATVNQRAVNDALRDVAVEEDVAFIDTVSTPIVRSEMIGTDRVNPTPAGHRAIASELVRRIKAVV